MLSVHAALKEFPQTGATGIVPETWIRFTSGTGGNVIITRVGFLWDLNPMQMHHVSHFHRLHLHTHWFCLLKMTPGKINPIRSDVLVKIPLNHVGKDGLRFLFSIKPSRSTRPFYHLPLRPKTKQNKTENKTEYWLNLKSRTITHTCCLKECILGKVLAQVQSTYCTCYGPINNQLMKLWTQQQGSL